MHCLNEAADARMHRQGQEILGSRWRRRGSSHRGQRSTDESQEIARSRDARVVAASERGYGAALLAGIRKARSRFIIMGDSNDSYDFSLFEGFVDKLREFYDLVMGNRFNGGIGPGAMPPLHKYLGDPVLSGIERLFFASRIRDFHC